MTCPLCHHPLTVFIKNPEYDVTCQCDNPECIMQQQNRVGKGERTQEAVDRFLGLCLRYEGAK